MCSATARGAANCAVLICESSAETNQDRIDISLHDFLTRTVYPGPSIGLDPIPIIFTTESGIHNGPAFLQVPQEARRMAASFGTAVHAEAGIPVSEPSAVPDLIASLHGARVSYNDSHTDGECHTVLSSRLPSFARHSSLPDMPPSMCR